MPAILIADDNRQIVSILEEYAKKKAFPSRPPLMGPLHWIRRGPHALI